MKTPSQEVFLPRQMLLLGSGGGSVGRASLPTPEVSGLNPISDINDQYSTNCIKNDKNKGKRGREWTIFRKSQCLLRPYKAARLRILFVQHTFSTIGPSALTPTKFYNSRFSSKKFDGRSN